MSAPARFDTRGLPLDALPADLHFAKYSEPVVAAHAGSSLAMTLSATVVPIDVQPQHLPRSNASALNIPNQKESLSFAWENVMVQLNHTRAPKRATNANPHEAPKPKVLLDSLNGVVQPGQLLGIMGPSGSGKTTLLDVLSGRLGSNDALTITGTRYVNGFPLTSMEGNETIKHFARYVPQEDHLMGTMSVRETLEFSANLQLPSSWSEQDKRSRVQSVMDELGLLSCADTRIGTVFQKGISGGQKRRVSIAIELLTLPQVLFLDEPTSGLDSAAAQNVIELLSRLAKGGRVVICTLHQPSSAVFARLDALYLLSRGKAIYFGPTSELVPYLATQSLVVPTYSNPADFALTAINTDFEAKHEDIVALNRGFLNSTFNRNIQANLQVEKQKKLGSPLHNEFTTGMVRQFWEISKRTLTDNVRNPGVYWVRILMYVMLSFMIGGVYVNMGHGQNDVQDRISLLFFVAAFMVFMSIAVVPTFIQDRAVMLRERNNGWYSEGPYVVAQTLCSLPGVFLLALTASIIICLLSTVSDDGSRFGYFLLNLFLSLLVAESFMTVISAIAPIYIIGMALGAGMFGMFMLTEGFFQIPSNIPPWFIWSYYIGFHTYTFEMFMYTEFHDRPVDCDAPVAVVNGVPVCRFADGNAVLDLFNMGNTRRWLDIVVLLINIVGYRTIFYVILKYMHRNKK